MTWSSYPAKPNDAAQIKTLLAAAAKTKHPPVIKAANLVKQKYGNLELARQKAQLSPDQSKAGEVIKKFEAAVLEAYNACFRAVKDAESAKDDDAPSGNWTVVESSNYKKEVGGVQDGAESAKLKAWLGGIKKLGPFGAADAQRIKCTPMSGGEYHVYLGKANRVYFKPDEKTQKVTLNGVKHR